jgi:hypothetical protein
MPQSPYIVDQRQTRGRPRTHAISQWEIDRDQSTRRGLELTEPKVNRPSGIAWALHDKCIYIDGEWHFDTNPQKFYLLGYQYDHWHKGWLYNQNDYEYNGKVYYKPTIKGADRLNRTWLTKLFEGVRTIYFYGPDAGQLERMFHLRMKDRYRCVNLLTVVRKIVPKEDMLRATFDYNLRHPGVLKNVPAITYQKYITEVSLCKQKPITPSYRLCVVEHLLGICRTTEEYKANCDNLHRDWYNPKLRAKALLYNLEDVDNLQTVKERLYGRYYISEAMENECTLQLTKADKEKFKTRK